MSSFLGKETQCVCKNKLVFDCCSSIYHVAIKMMYSQIEDKTMLRNIMFAQQSNNEIEHN